MAQRSRFFAANNLAPLHEKSVKYYLDALPPVSIITQRLQDYFEITPCANLTLASFIQAKNLSTECLQLPPVNLVKKDLKLHPSREDPSFNCPREFHEIRASIVFYLDLISDVLNNQLAHRLYEAGVPEHENVTERQHAFQAAKIGMLLGFSDSEVLAMSLHDIARPTVHDETHGHQHHCQEGDDILKPLGLAIDYSYLHAFAKFLLNEFCAPYQALISPVSQTSLVVQKTKFKEQAQRLLKLPPEALAKTLLQIMLMRLIDDMSKVPADLGFIGDEHLIEAKLKILLAIQMERHLLRLTLSNENKEIVFNTFKHQLDQAIHLLARAKKYSNNPSIYPDTAIRYTP